MRVEVERKPAPWMGVVLLTALACTVLDAVVLQRRYGIFAAGFLSTYRITGLGWPYFFLGSLLVDASVAAILAAPMLWLTRRCRATTRLLLSSMLCILVVQVATASRFDINLFVGDMIQYRLFPGSNIDTGWLGTGVLALAAVGASLLVVPLARIGIWTPLCRGSRTRRRAVMGGGLLLVLAFVFLLVTGLRSAGMQEQFARKTTGSWLMTLIESATDFDGDGFGLVRQPTDTRPFDGRFHPWAVDRPGNGLDENGIGGDLDARGDFTFERFDKVEFKQRPDVLLVVLESFRRDNLERELDGKPVAPVLRRLVREGAVTGPAYSHNGYTIESLAHLFTGSLTLTVETSIIDDFNANGYTTACVSGEDESFGGIKQLTGLARADYFVDARNNVDERTSAFSTPGSLAVPWPVIVRNVGELLDKEGAKDAPLFCYINFQDCHFPYTHEAMKPLLADNPIPRSEIRRENVEWVRRTYLNAAANVDAALGRILAEWERKRGRKPAFVIVSDHGESFYADGVLGHGIKITREQTEVVFVVGGLGVECVFPLGHAQVRRLVRDALTGESRKPSAVIDPARWIFQYTGTLDRPRMLGGGMANGGIVYLFGPDQFRLWGKPRKGFPKLARFWEQIRLFRAEHGR